MKFFFHTIKSKVPQSMIAHIQKPYHFFLSLCGAVVYGFPSRKLIVIGVTGTKGKTTVVELLHSILEAHGARVASVSSLRFRIANQESLNTLGMTMPGRFFLQHFFWRAVRQKCAYAVVEVTSQGIEQYRHRFIDFDVGVLTNIAPEHLEAHGGFEPYVRAKLDFFWRLHNHGVAVINRSDQQASRVAAACSCTKAWYGKESIDYKKHVWPIRNYNSGNYGIMFDIKGHQITSRLHGDMNAENILAAIAVCLTLRIPFEAMSQGISSVKEICGRMQIIQEKPFRVVVDYAHTPDSLERVYESFQKKTDVEHPFHNDSATAVKNRLICVLGAAGGGRDTWKRPEFGRIAAAYCHEIIITNEDPFDEPPTKIMEAIAKGVKQSQFGGTLEIIEDRREAIRQAFSTAKECDTVIITGKGSESYIRAANGERIPWDDCTVVREELKTAHIPEFLTE